MRLTFMSPTTNNQFT